MWITISTLIFSAGVLALALFGESDDTTKAVAIIVTLTGLALMATALWEGINTRADWSERGHGRDDR